jgi:F-type H+-transporting ATPase subunit gamma
VNRMGGRIVSQVVNYGDRPALERLIGPVKMLVDGYLEGRLDEVHIFSNRFVNTMKQEPIHATMIPIPQEWLTPEGTDADVEKVGTGNWDYLYEPDAKTVLDELLVRYLETFVYQAAADNIASEQSARMVAMKAASDNAQNIIEELQLIYNKSRQAAITKELSEIVAGAAAV